MKLQNGKPAGSAPFVNYIENPKTGLKPKGMRPSSRSSWKILAQAFRRAVEKLS